MLISKEYLDDIADKLNMMANNHGINPSYELALKNATYIIRCIRRELEEDNFQVTSFKLEGKKV